MSNPLSNFILSPCGTSLLTNGASKEESLALRRYSNATEKEIPAREKDLIKQRIASVRQKLLEASPHQVTELSAELHAIVKYYNYKMDHKSDWHHLLVTDTWLGETTGELIREWLESQGINTYIFKQNDLQTNELNRFELALSELVVWCENNIPEGFHVVFNLTGGFKSIQGFLQTLAMFYADEAIYIFESGEELLRLPKLPVRIDPDEVLKEYFPLLRKLELNLQVTIPEKLPRTLLMQVDHETALSPYGQIIYQQMKSTLYRQQIFDPPVETIRFGPHFKDSVLNIPDERKKIINERIDDLAEYFQSGRVKNIKRLDFKALTGNPKPPSTHEIDAWADQDARRIYGHYENGTFVLDQFGKAIH